IQQDQHTSPLHGIDTPFQHAPQWQQQWQHLECKIRATGSQRCNYHFPDQAQGDQQYKTDCRNAIQKWIQNRFGFHAGIITRTGAAVHTAVLHFACSPEQALRHCTHKTESPAMTENTTSQYAEDETQPTAGKRKFVKIDTSNLSGMLRYLGARAAEKKITQVASSLTFTTVLATVPMLAVILSLFTAFPLFSEFRTALEAFLADGLMPPAVSENVMKYLNQFAAQASRLTAIGSLFLFVTSMSLIMTI